MLYASDLIEELQKIIENHGDLPVEIYNSKYDIYDDIRELKYHPESVYNNGSYIEIVRD